MPGDRETSPTGHVAPSLISFRNAMSQFCTGVAVVTGHDHDGPVGFTCQSFSSLSLDPPLVLICPGRSSTSWPRIRSTGRFCVNILGHHQEALSTRFSQTGEGKFTDVDWVAGPMGVPQIRGAIAHIDCLLETIHEGGDHEIVIGRVVEVAHQDETHPLLYFRSRYSLLHKPV